MSTAVEQSGKHWVNFDDCPHIYNGEHDAKVEITDSGANGVEVTLSCRMCGAETTTSIKWANLS